jgi:hypothetical protein
MGDPGGSDLAGITANSFSDDFNRANTIIGLGPNWVSNHGMSVTSGIWNTTQILNNQLRCFRTGGAGNANPIAFMFVVPTFSQVWGQEQFAQCRFIAINLGTAPGSGPAVMLKPDDLDGNSACGYGILIHTATTLTIAKMTNGVAADLTAALPVAVNDLMGIDVVPGALVNTVRYIRNGVVHTTVADPIGGGPLFQGSPGFMVYLDAGDTIDFDDYSCGVGLLV